MPPCHMKLPLFVANQIADDVFHVTKIIGTQIGFSRRISGYQYEISDIRHGKIYLTLSKEK